MKAFTYTINAGGRLLDLSEPKVMGILNATPDSFFAGSRRQTEAEIADRANEIVEQGGEIIDVGAFSTRPGADEVSCREETGRLRRALAIVRREQPDAVLSVDTYRPSVARMCVEEFGADIINDVSEGGITGIVNTPIHEEESMFETVARLGVAYILMSVKPDLYSMMKAFAEEVQQLRDNESHYYFFVTEVAGSGQTAPLETRRATIRRILFNLRQAEVIRSHEEELVDAALAEGEAKIYGNRNN